MEEVQLLCLIEDATTGGDAWRRLWRFVEPQLWALVGRPRFASHLAHSEPARRRIVDAVRAALGPSQLRRFLETRRINPRVGFERWLRTMTKRIGFGYATSARYGRQLQT